MTATAELGREVMQEQKRELLKSLLARKAGRPRTAALSLAQRRLWIHHLLNRQSHAFNIANTYRIEGPLDVASLKKSLNRILCRHESLRTTFEMRDGEPLQVVNGWTEAALQEIDVRHLPTEEQASGVRDKLVLEAKRPFDMERGPLFRFFLMRVGQESFYFFFLMHHIVADAWSFDVFNKELERLYSGFQQGQEVELESISESYLSYSTWEAGRYDEDVLAAELSHWETYLEGMEATEVRGDRPRPPKVTHNGRVHYFQLAEGQSQAMRAVAREAGTSFFLANLAAFHAFLCRYLGLPDVNCGVPVSNRSKQSAESLIGFFVNILILRSCFSANPSFVSSLANLRKSSRGLYTHSHLPFERLVERLRPQRDVSRSPLYQMTFQLADPPVLSLAGVRVREEFEQDYGIVRSDFELYLGNSGRGIIVYSEDLYDPGTIAELARRFAVLYSGLVESPECGVLDLPLMTREEELQVLVEWNRKVFSVPVADSLQRKLEDQVERTPEAVAAVLGGAAISYAELNRRANRIAHLLRARGVGPESVVALSLARSLEMVWAIWGVLKAGGAYLPCPRRQPADRLRQILADSGSVALLVDAPAPAGLPVAVLDLGGLGPGAWSDENPPLSAGPENLAYVIYTSGSTGRPKGVMIENRAPLELARAMTRLCYRDIRQPMRMSLNAPIEFDASVQQLAMMTEGHCLVIVPAGTRQDAAAFVEYVREQRVEVLDCTPQHLSSLLEAGLLEEPGQGPRKIVAAGGAIDRSMWRRLANAETTDAYNIYGPTECTVNAMGHPITDPELVPRIGSPLANYAIYLLDERGKPVPTGARGEISIGGAGLARGYLARPARTALGFGPDPFSGAEGGRIYRTGDHARRLEDGTLEFVGRRDDQVKLRGLRIELGEISQQLREHPRVRDVAVLMEDRPASRGAALQVLVAYTVLRSDEGEPEGELRGFLRRRLPEYMVPAAFVFLDKLPLTASGKLDRKALVFPSSSQKSAGQARSVVEEMVLEIWAEALGVSRGRVGLTSDFLELGGHSLLAARLASRSQEVFRVDVPPGAVFEHPTPVEFAGFLDERRSAARASLPRVEARGAPEPWPLSMAQERLWFLDQMESQLAAYHIPLNLRLNGPLRHGVLAAALQRVVARHDALRTFFPLRGGKAVQSVASPAIAIEFPLVDLSALGVAERERAALALAAEDAGRPFALDRFPLFRMKLLRLAGEDHLLVFCLHHIVTDAWSIRLMLRDLAGIYAELLAGRVANLPDLPVTYVDYSLWQRRLAEAESMKDHQAYWLGRLAGSVPLLDLPVDRPRGKAFRYRGRNHFFSFPATVTEAVIAAAPRCGTTTFMFLAAAIQLLLSRSTGEEDVWLGSPVANRPRAELEELAGLFINLVVLRGDLAPGQTVRALLEQTRDRVVEASDHQALPFERLVEMLNPERSLSHSPLFQVMFTFQNVTGSWLEIEGVESRLMTVENGTAKLDLTFDFAETAEDIEGRIEFNSDVFDLSTIQRMEKHLNVLLQQMAARPAQRLEAVPLLTLPERFQVVSEWNDTAAKRDGTSRLNDLFSNRAGRHPDRIAVICGTDHLTYRAIDRRSNQLAHALRQRFVQGSRIGVYLPRSPDMVVTVLGILKAGDTYVPIDPIYPEERIGQILSIGETAAVVSCEALAGGVPGLRANMVLLDRIAWEELPTSEVASAADSGSLAYVIFTSGSTGKPKGVALQHAPVVNLIEWVNESFGIGAEDCLLFVTSLCFDLSVYDIFGVLAAGAAVRVAGEDEAGSPEALLDILYRERITFWDSAPAALSRLQPLFDAERGRGARLRLAFLSGDWIPVGLPDEVRSVFRKAEVVALGGATEAAIWSNSFRVGEVAGHWKSIPYGRPIKNARYLILDPALQPCPIRGAGDLYIGGECLSFGYVSQAAQTARQYLPDPWSARPGSVLYATGDRARFLADGNVEFLGRLDHQVKIRGFRIELGEIESALRDHEGVHEAVVLVREDTPGIRRLAAYVQKASPAVEGTALTGAALRDALQARLPAYMVPNDVVFVSGWPVTANGKLDRAALPRPQALESAAADSYVAPRDPEEASLARIWTRVLGLESVGVEDNFFDLGGDSILAIQIVAQARRTGMEIRPRDFFETQTIAALAEVSRKASGAKPRLLQASAEAVVEAAPTAVQQWFFDRSLANPNHFNQAILLEWKFEPEVEVLRRSLRRLSQRHDALRLRFERSRGAAAGGGSEGGWRQVVRPFAAEWPIDLRIVGREEASTDADRLAIACEVQASLDIERGPLLAACLFAGDAVRPFELLLVVHHLAVDAVSWRPLIADFAAAYSSECGDEESSHDAGNGSWIAWAARAAPSLSAERFADQEEFWIAQKRREPLPRDGSGGPAVAATARTLTGRLTAAETESLSIRVPKAYPASTLELLLAALARAFVEANGASGVTVDLESHGRSPLLFDGDLSSTVGWFTSLYPLHLELDAGSAPGEAVKSVKEQVRAVPGDGVGYMALRFGPSGTQSRLAQSHLARVPGPEILFNYLGRFEAALMENALFKVSTERTGEDTDGANVRSHGLEITCLVVDGLFETRWRFSPELYRAATVEGWMRRFLVETRRLVAHCSQPGARGFTPSDFPLAAIGQDALDRLVDEFPGLEDLYPATQLQQGMLFHGELEPETGVYLQQIRMELEGDLDGAGLRAAVAAVIQRHACLRTVFRVADDHYLQLVDREPGNFWRQEDLADLSPEAQGRRLERLAREDLERRFATSREPLFRLALLRLGARRHQLVITFHHAIMDGWSLAILVEEIDELYRASREERAANLAPTIPGRKYSAWLAAQDPEPARAFWRKSLAGFTHPVQIGRSGAPGAAQLEPCRDRAILPKDLVARIEQAARRHRMTPSALIQAAWALLVSRYSHARDVVIGITTSGREGGLQGIERMVGLFINTLPLRLAVDDQTPVGRWLKEAQRRTLDVRRFDHFPLAQVQAASGLAKGRSLFESIVVVENYPFQEASVSRWLGHRTEAVQIHEKANFPLSVLVEIRSELVVELNSRPGTFEPLETRRMQGHLAELLRSLAGDGSRPLGSVGLLSAAERHQVVVEVNDTEDREARRGCIHLEVEKQAEATADRLAVVCGDEALSYRALAARSAAIAHDLVRRGVARGSRVGLHMVRSVPAIAAILGIMKAGAAYVPLDTDLPLDRLRFMVDECGARWVITKGERGSSRILEADGRIDVIDLEVLDLGAVEAGGGLPEADPDGLAYLIYTSGSTGRPKAVMVPHRSVLNLLHGMLRELYGREPLGSSGLDRTRDGLRISLNAPLSFDASVQQIVMLCDGHTLDIVPRTIRKEGSAFVEFVASRRIESLDFTPTHLQVLLNAGLLSEPALALTRVAVAGGAVDAHMWSRLAAAGRTRFFNVYGPTECTVNATARQIRDPQETPNIGVPLANHRVYVLDKSLRVAPMAVGGQLLIAGDGLAGGYHARPSLTAEGFLPDPFASRPGRRLYQTGDLVRTLPSGRLEFLGRVDHQVKIRGFRIEIGEVENALLRHENIFQAVVVLDGKAESLRLVAFYSTRDGAELGTSAIRSFAARWLPEYMLPSATFHHDRFPLLESGKVDRTAVPDPSELLQARDRTPPQTESEAKVARLWSEILAVDDVGREDDFLSLGGHSLNAVLLTSRMQRDFGLEISLQELYGGIVVRQISERLAQDEIDLMDSDRGAQLLSELQGLSPKEIQLLLAQERDRIEPN